MNKCCCNIQSHAGSHNSLALVFWSVHLRIRHDVSQHAGLPPNGEVVVRNGPMTPIRHHPLSYCHWTSDCGVMLQFGRSVLGWGRGALPSISTTLSVNFVVKLKSGGCLRPISKALELSTCKNHPKHPVPTAHASNSHLLSTPYHHSHLQQATSAVVFTIFPTARGHPPNNTFRQFEIN